MPERNIILKRIINGDAEGCEMVVDARRLENVLLVRGDFGGHSTDRLSRGKVGLCKVNRRLKYTYNKTSNGDRLLRTVTSTTLLQALLNPEDTDAWYRFHERYWPMVISFARKQGLGESDAEDAAQETLVAFMQSYRQGSFDHQKGQLRSWLFGIAYKKVVNILRKRGRENVISARADGTCFLNSIPSNEEAEAKWDTEWRQSVLQACLQEIAQSVKGNTYQAFELYVLKQIPVDLVAEQMGMTENAVYIAKNRVISKMRQLAPQMEEIW